MKVILLGTTSIVIALLFSHCTPKAGHYSLPNVHAEGEPHWVGTHKTTRDTIFIVINIPQIENAELDQYVQNAQSELHNLLSSEIELILRDYWVQKQVRLGDEQKFQLLADLPRTMEQIMNNVSIKDGWTNGEEVSILCALDYEKIAISVMRDVSIKDRSFLAYFKRRMDEFAHQHR